MSWQGLEGHDLLVERFRRAIRRGRLAGAYLFVGPAGVGKWTFALRLAQTLFCERRDPAEMNPCGACGGCIRTLAKSHPDLLLVCREGRESEIPVAKLIGPRENRMREGLCYNIAMKPFAGGRKFAIIDDADTLNEEGANALLKTLEEPPPRSTLVLIATNLQRQLPTIRSRCLTIPFAPLDESTVARLLVEKGLAPDAALARQVALQCGGSLTQAVELADPELWEFRQTWLNDVVAAEWNETELIARTTKFVEAAGKEAVARRQRLRQILGFAEVFYRQLSRTLCGHAPAGDEVLRRAVRAAVDARRWSAVQAARSTQRCVTAAAQVDANANQATLIAAWLDDLALLNRGQLVVEM